jgi:hypothetical protein
MSEEGLELNSLLELDSGYLLEHTVLQMASTLLVYLLLDELIKGNVGTIVKPSVATQ